MSSTNVQYHGHNERLAVHYQYQILEDKTIIKSFKQTNISTETCPRYMQKAIFSNLIQKIHRVLDQLPEYIIIKPAKFSHPTKKLD